MQSPLIGIDPGLSGGIAVIDSRGVIMSLHHMPLTLKGDIDGKAIAAIAATHSATHAVVELVHSRPRQAGVFTFGYGTGIIHGALQATNVNITTVAPQKWKAFYNIHREPGETKKAKKDEARKIATELYPDHARFFARVKDDGVAEALLIALYHLSNK